MRTHTGTHALRAVAAAVSASGKPELQVSSDPCDVVDVEGLGDEDFKTVDVNDDDALDALLGMLAGNPDPQPQDEKFAQFMKAIQAGDADLAERLLAEHNIEIGDGVHGDEQEEVAELINEQQSGPQDSDSAQA